MKSLKTFIRKVSNKAAAYPVAAFICFILGIVLIFWFAAALFDNLISSRKEREYKAKTAANEKIFQTALIEAEKANQRSQIAEDNANKIIEANNKRAEGLIKSDNALLIEIKNSEKEGDIKKNENETFYNNELRRASNMSDSERAADNCERIKRLAASNPAFANFRCANVAETNANAAGEW